MPAPPRTPANFREILELVWWRLDAALDLEMIRASARLGALEALECGTTAIVDHHESPNAIEGSLTVIADACAEVGVRVVAAYGVTDRHGPAGAVAGLAENERFFRGGGRGLVGIHAAFTCTRRDDRSGGRTRARTRRRRARARCRRRRRPQGGEAASVGTPPTTGSSCIASTSPSPTGCGGRSRTIRAAT